MAEELETPPTTGTAEEDQALDLDVKIEEASACQRHITVTVPREDIDRYFDEEFSEMMETAFVPGFRVGHAPRKLIESRYRREVSDKIKSALLMDSMTQINEQHKLSAISEPDLDVEAVEIPKEGPLTFEFDLEVRPEFDLPQWKGLTIERPTTEFNKEDVDRRLKSLLAKHGRLVPHEGPAESGDYVTLNITVSDGDEVVNQISEETVMVRPALSFHDGKIENFGKLIRGAQPGDQKKTKIQLSDDAPNEAVRGKQLQVTLEVLDVKKLELPEMTKDFLQSLGDFDSEGDLRDTIQQSLQRQLAYRQQQQARQQVTDLLTESAKWELPPELLKRQSSRELQRAVLELRRSGFGEDEIRAHENELRQNSQATTARALREHFILEKIAEEEGMEANDEDYESEIHLIAAQSGESSRRVRAQIEKGGHWDSLRNQIIERKVIDLVLSEAQFKDIPFELPENDVEAIDQAAGGEEKRSEIPQAKHAPAGTLREPEDHA